MPHKISGTHLAKLQHHYGRLSKRLHSVRQKGEKATEKLISAAEVSAGAFAFGLTQGRYGAVNIVGIPMDLGTGVILHAAGFMGLAGKHSDHLHAFADGALASFFFTLGRGTGIQWKTQTAARIRGETNEAPKLTEAEKAALAK